MQAQPGQIAVEPFPVGGRSKVTVLDTPIGDRAAYAVHEVPHAALPLRSAQLAVKVFAHDDVRGQLAPRRRNLAVGLLEDNVTVLPFDRGRTQIPFHRVKGIFGLDRTEGRVDGQTFTRRRLGCCSVVLTAAWPC